MLHLLALLLLSPLALAFRLDPMVVSLPLTAPQASGTYVVENNTKEKIAVQFEVRKRVVTVDGKEERPEATGFLVYPEQMALEPGEKRNVRVSWTAEAMPEQELAFRFVASQLPVNFAKEKEASRSVKFKFLMEYVASLYLVPPRVRPKMRLLKHETKNGALELLVANEGGAHFLLDRTEVTAKSAGKPLAFGRDTLNDLKTENILAGSQRLLRLALPKDFKGKELDVSIQFDP